MAHDVFISHAARDKVVADAVCARLELRHIRCWIAPRDITPGTAYADAIIGALSACRIVVVLLSSESIGSAHVASELERALHNGKAILPVRIEDVYPTGSLEYYLAGKHWLDALTPPMEAHLDKVAEAAGRLLGIQAKDSSAPSAPSAPPPPAKPSGFLASKTFKEADALRKAGQHAQAVPIYRQALEMFEAIDDQAGAALCANNMAFSLQPNNNPDGSWDQAISTYRKAQAWRETLGDKAGQVIVLGNIGFCLRLNNNPAGNWQEAFKAFRRQAAVAGEVADKPAEARALADAAWCSMPTRNTQGNWVDSATLCRQAAEIYEQLKDGLNHGLCLQNGAFSLIQGEKANLTDETRQLFRRSAEVLRGVGADEDAKFCEDFVKFATSAADQVYDQACAAFNSHQWAQAAPLMAQAAEIFAAEGNLSRQALCLHNQAWCLDPSRNPAGNWATCVELYHKAAELYAAAGDATNQANSLGNIGCALYPTSNPDGNWAEARKYLQQAVELKRKVNDKGGEGTYLSNLAFTYQPDKDPAGSWEKAIELNKVALPLRVAAQDVQGQASTLNNLAHCTSPQRNPAGDWQEAGAYYRQASDVYRGLGNLQSAGEGLHSCAFCLIQGDGKNMTEETWEMFRLAAQHKRQAGDMEGAKVSESWLH